MSLPAAMATRKIQRNGASRQAAHAQQPGLHLVRGLCSAAQGVGLPEVSGWFGARLSVSFASGRATRSGGNPHDGIDSTLHCAYVAPRENKIVAIDEGLLGFRDWMGTELWR